MYEKDFDNWNHLKRRLNNKDALPLFHERQIWWGSLGANIGHEEDGKNQEFSRPILIVKKFNDRLFWGVPLTTKIKENRHYHALMFREQKQCAMLTQMRLWDANRLTRRMGIISKVEHQKIKNKLVDYLK